MAHPQPHGPAIPPISSHRGSRHRRHLAFLAVVALLTAVVAVGVAYTATASSATLDTRVLEPQCRNLVTAQLGHPAGMAECDVLMANMYPYWENVDRSI